MTALDLLTGDAQTFAEKVWARSVHRHRLEPGPTAELTGLLTLTDADRLLTGSGIRTPAIRVARDGSVRPESTFVRRGATIAGQPITGLVDVKAILRQFDQGATVVFQGLHRYWPPLTRFVADLEAELGHPCQANAYLTPPGAQGFAVHADTHDVFVFQTHGRKQWEIHPVGADGERHPEPVLLEPGLVMYLPTGTPHAARAETEASLHVTIGVNQLTWRAVVRRATAALLAEVDDEHLPAGYPADPSVLRAGLADRLTALADRVRAVDPDRAVATEVDRFLTTRHTRWQGGLTDRLAARTMTDTTRVRRRPGSVCVIRPAAAGADGGSRVRLLLGDRAISAPAWVRAAVEQLATGAELRPADLPIDPQSRLVLCRRLVREGLLEILDPIAPDPG